MGRLMIPNLKVIAGLNYYRVRIAGKAQYHRLPAMDDPEFWPAYYRYRDSSTAKDGPAHGSIAALIAQYRASSDFRGIKSDDTRANYLRYLGMIEEKLGSGQVHQLRPAKIYELRDRLAETPGTANNWLSILRTLMSYATKIDWRADNPAAGIKALPIGAHEPWPADLVEVCLAVATPMTRLLIATGLCSGQRVGDVIRMQHGWIKDGVMEFRQSKTGVDVALPVHPFWRAELDRLPRKSVTLMYDRIGTPFGTTGAVQSRMRDLMAKEEVQGVIADLVAREKADPNRPFVFHGLRKNACCYLLETGRNDTEVGSMLGMSASMVRHYGKRARALMVAKTAAAEMIGGKLLSLPGVNTGRDGPFMLRKPK